MVWVNIHTINMLTNSFINRRAVQIVYNFKLYRRWRIRITEIDTISGSQFVAKRHENFPAQEAVIASGYIKPL
ncbi:hypothetical protein BLA39750_00972 [Burkholderia lata]|uniref:Uncharacterized protein n=1 Tax=Burkholderia lata (strain ATCC 17760 / DSM 23089 / LMG 22485 / NCIMB 9086 / R18194 / 383) TaxID=482957 RepID=A0A6P2V2D0_BURL3|nr:hypothetical protein BLA39750_00972 [Burkholderia lata]